MYSPTSINRICRMDYPTNKIIDFHPMHLSMIKMNDFDKDNFEYTIAAPALISALSIEPSPIFIEVTELSANFAVVIDPSAVVPPPYPYQ